MANYVMPWTHTALTWDVVLDRIHPPAYSKSSLDLSEDGSNLERLVEISDKVFTRQVSSVQIPLYGLLRGVYTYTVLCSVAPLGMVWNGFLAARERLTSSSSATGTKPYTQAFCNDAYAFSMGLVLSLIYRAAYTFARREQRILLAVLPIFLALGATATLGSLEVFIVALSSLQADSFSLYLSMALRNRFGVVNSEGKHLRFPGVKLEYVETRGVLIFLGSLHRELMKLGGKFLLKPNSRDQVRKVQFILKDLMELAAIGTLATQVYDFFLTFKVREFKARMADFSFYGVDQGTSLEMVRVEFVDETNTYPPGKDLYKCFKDRCVTANGTSVKATELLGVSLDASKQEINRAYYKLMRQIAPDKNGNSAESQKLTQIAVAAYQILSSRFQSEGS